MLVAPFIDPYIDPSGTIRLRWVVMCLTYSPTVALITILRLELFTLALPRIDKYPFRC